MKGIVQRLLFLLLVATAGAVQAQFTYTTNADGISVTITGYTNSNTVVLIPADIDGLTVTAIGTNAFYGTNLTSVMIPASVTIIGANAFAECGALTNAAILPGVTNIGSGAFLDTGLTSVTIPASVTTIGTNAFEYCGGLTAITVATNNPTYTSSNGVLFDAAQTTVIEYPPGLRGDYTIPDTVTAIGDSAFQWCQYLTNVSIPDSVAAIGAMAFWNCPLSSVTIPGSVGTIGTGAFSFCERLTNATILSGITNIGPSAFSASSLTTVTIPASVTAIGANAFSSTSLATVSIPASVTAIGANAFSLCFGLGAINVDTNNAGYSSINGVLFNKTQTTLIQYPCARLGGYTIPESVRSIGDSAFEFSSGLTNVAIPPAVTNVGAYAFGSCLYLTNLTIAAGVTHIGSYAFEDDISLVSIFFGGNAPAADLTIFFGNFGPPSTIVYYLPGTSGWSFIFPPGLPFDGGVATVLWNPLIQTADGSFGVRDGQFGFNIAGTTNIPIVVEASTDLSASVWTPISAAKLANGLLYFSDPQWTNYPARYYRISSP